MTALLTLAAVLLDAVLGEPRRWHPLVGFGNWAQSFERVLNTEPNLRMRGVLAVFLAVAPWVSLVALITANDRIPFVARCLVSVLALYFAIGHQSLRQHALSVHEALERDDLPEARQRVGMIVSRDTGSMDSRAVAVATVESVLENGNDAVFGALFWFVVGGAPAAILYRLVNTLDAMWGYRTTRFFYFGWAAAKFDDVLNFVPARLTALTYALIGHTKAALYCWRSQASAWESPNAGPVMAAGAGALGVGLGGGAYYHREREERPPLGVGPPPDAASIPAALRLVRLGIISWLLVVAAVAIIGAVTHA